MSYSYKRLTLFTERLNRFKCSNMLCCNECSNEYFAHNMLTDKFNKSYCEECVKQVIKLNKHLRLRSNYHFVLNEEQFNKMINDFIIVNNKFSQLRKEWKESEQCLNMNFSNVVAQLLIYNKYATRDECKQYNLFLLSAEKNKYYENLWAKISIELSVV